MKRSLLFCSLKLVAASPIGPLVLAMGIMAVNPVSNAAPCPPGENLADTDDDGLYDYACVGDWNNSGFCEMEQDIRTAIQRLDDPGEKVVELEACSFSSPSTALDDFAIIEIPSNTTVFGAGAATILNGFAPTDLVSTQAVLGNNSHDPGNSNIVIRDLAINGGWQGGDATGLGHSRMGVFFSSCDQCRAENLTITDTLHACLYASNSDGIEFLDSTLERCGNYTGLGNTFPCVYVFASDGDELRNVTVSGIDCDGSGSSALTTRRGSESATLTNLLFEDNVVRNTRPDSSAAPKHCILVSGVGSAQYLNNTCENTGGFASIYSEAYYSDGGDRNASANVLVDGLDLYDSWSFRAPVTIDWHAEDFTLRHITVHGAESSCVWIRPPVRNFVLEQSSLIDCDGYGVATIGSIASAHGLTLDNIVIDGAGSDGIELVLDSVLRSADITVSGNYIHDFGKNSGGAETCGVGLSGNVEDGIVSGNILEDVHQQATCGVFQNIPVSNPAYLCTNVCQGTLSLESCLYPVGESAYWTDLDGDESVDACDPDDDADEVLDDDDNCVMLFNPLQLDTDLDGVGDACDNCTLDFNPAQADGDGDLEGDWCDTNDGLIHLFSQNPERVEWLNEDGFLEWNAYKGDLDLLFEQGKYTQLPGSNPIAEQACAVTNLWYDDVENLPAGKTAFYLVTGIAASAEGSLGNDSTGSERDNDNPCPPAQFGF